MRRVAITNAFNYRVQASVDAVPTLRARLIIFLFLHPSNTFPFSRGMFQIRERCATFEPQFSRSFVRSFFPTCTDLYIFTYRVAFFSCKLETWIAQKKCTFFVIDCFSKTSSISFKKCKTKTIWASTSWKFYTVSRTSFTVPQMKICFGSIVLIHQVWHKLE